MNRERNVTGIVLMSLVSAQLVRSRDFRGELAVIVDADCIGGRTAPKALDVIARANGPGTGVQINSKR